MNGEDSTLTSQFLSREVTQRFQVSSNAGTPASYGVLVFGGLLCEDTATFRFELRHRRTLVFQIATLLVRDAAPTWSGNQTSIP